MIGLDAVPARLHELGHGSEPGLDGWLQLHGFDAELMRFVGQCAAHEALRSPGAAGADVGKAATAFLSGFVCGLCMRDAFRDESLPPADALTKAFAVVGARGRHAVIADHCDLSAVADVETRFVDAVTDGLGVEERSELVRLFESGLATGLVVV